MQYLNILLIGDINCGKKKHFYIHLFINVIWEIVNVNILSFYVKFNLSQLFHRIGVSYSFNNFKQYTY